MRNLARGCVHTWSIHVDSFIEAISFVIYCCYYLCICYLFIYVQVVCVYHISAASPHSVHSSVPRFLRTVRSVVVSEALHVCKLLSLSRSNCLCVCRVT